MVFDSSNVDDWLCAGGGLPQNSLSSRYANGTLMYAHAGSSITVIPGCSKSGATQLCFSRKPKMAALSVAGYATRDSRLKSS